jgi:hypothetical protein
VLVDYASYARRHGIEINHFSGHAITLKDLLAAAAEQGVEFRTGDVLFLRTGYVAGYKELDSDGRERVAQVREWCGLGQSRETTEWLWERQFAAVASDSPGFEVRRTYSLSASSATSRLTLSSARREAVASPPYSTGRLGDSARGVVRSGGAGKHLCQDSALVVLLYFLATELYGRCRLAAKCDGHSIDNMNRLIAQNPLVIVPF